MPALQREAAWAKEVLLGDLWQSVPQTGRVHLHIIALRDTEGPVMGTDDVCQHQGEGPKEA